MNYLELEQLVFGYASPKGPVINDISLSFSLGEQVALIGRNGAGKTTLAKLIIGMLKPQHGKIILAGEDTRKKSIAEVARKVGFVFQNPNWMLFTNSVEKELKLSLKRFNLPKEEEKEKIEQLIEFFKMEHYRRNHPRLLSRGEKQKLALATVLIQEPKAIIFDEPFSGVDRSQRASLMDYINKLKTQGKLVILITHDLEVVLESCERTIALADGKISFDGLTLEFHADPSRLEEIGLEETPMLSMLYSLRKDGLPRQILRRADLVSFFRTKLNG